MTGREIVRRGRGAPAGYTVVDEDGAEVSPLAAVQVLTSTERLEMLAALSERVDEACRALLTDQDTEQGFWKKSAFRKVGRAFGIQLETLEADFEWKPGPTGDPVCVGHARVRASAPWGQTAEAEGHCTNREDSFHRKVSGRRIPNESAQLQAEHRTVAIAETRAKNRAIDDLLAIGRAEEVMSDEAAAEAAEEQRRKLMLELTTRWKDLLIEHDVTDEEERAFCEGFRAGGDRFEDWGPAERQTAILHVEKRGRDVFESALEWKRRQAEADDPVREAADRVRAGEHAPVPCPDPACDGQLEEGMAVCPVCGQPPAGPPETDAEAFERSIRNDPLGEGEGDTGADTREEDAGGGRRPAPPLVQRKAELTARITELADQAGQDPTYPSQLLAAVLDARGVKVAELPELRLAEVRDLEAVAARLEKEVASPDAGPAPEEDSDEEAHADDD